METRARYLLVGIFAMAVIAAGFGFLYWLNNTGGLAARTAYLIRFDTPVSGLLRGAPVLFNGIRTGEVTELRFDPDDPRRIVVEIAVDAATPIHADTTVGLEFGGLTGAASISLTGGTATSPLVTASDGETPLLVADPAASQSWTEAGREVLHRLNLVLADNADSFRGTMANLERFSGALARNSDKVDGILGGLERLTGGGAAKAPPVTYDLDAPTQFPPIAGAPSGQIEVALPKSVVAMDTQRILVQSGDGETPAFDDAQWADTLPLLVQTNIAQAFENARYGDVAPSTDGFQGDVQLLIDLRRFRISTSPTQAAEVEFGAKVLGADGKLSGAKVFRSTEPVAAMDAASAASALDRAFGKAVTELVPWVLANMPAVPGVADQ